MRRLLNHIWAVLLLVGVVLLALSPSPALADDQTTNFTNTFSTAGVISLLVGTGLPLLVGFITDERWAAGVKFFVLAVLSGVSAVLSQWLEAMHNNLPFAWQSAVLSAILTLITAELTYVQGWKKTAIGKAAAAGPPLSLSGDLGPDDDYAKDIPDDDVLNEAPLPDGQDPV